MDRKYPNFVHQVHGLDNRGAIIPVANLGTGETESHTTAISFTTLTTPHQRFHVVPTVATKEALDIVYDIIFSAVNTYNLTSLSGFFVGLSPNAITENFLAVSNSGIGTPMGNAEDAVFLVEEVITWSDDKDTPLIEEFIKIMNENIMQQLEKIGASIPYLYLNDADQMQDIFAGYPREYVQRLKDIRNRYDPELVYTYLMPGGFKVAHASC